MSSTLRPIQAPLPSWTTNPVHTNYQSVGHTAYHNVGLDEAGVWRTVGIAAIAGAAFHGYRRNRSVGWAIGWALLAGLSPLITIGVAAAQGFGKRKGS